jgi:PAS domain S-box-containing protein
VKVTSREDRKELAGWSPEYLAAIVDSSDDAIIGKTLDGTIISWNKGAEQIYGYTAEEVVGKPIAVLIPRDRPDELPAIFERLRRGERIDHYQTERIRKDGKRLTMSVTISPVRDSTGTIVGASAIGRDITEQAQAIHEALRARDDFISIAAHELRTPLTTVYARLQLAERRIGRPGYEHDGLRQDLSIVRSGADKLRSLVDRLMDVSRIRSGRLKLDLAPTDVIALTRKLAVELAETAGREIVVHGPSSSRDLLAVDAVRIEEVLTNLIDNAMKYSAADQPIEVDVADEAPEIRLTVSDRGPGIPVEERERVFEPFHRANQQTQGVGLGLHIAREIMGLHGGSLTVKERDGGGSTFVLTLPKRTSR